MKDEKKLAPTEPILKRSGSRIGFWKSTFLGLLVLFRFSFAQASTIINPGFESPALGVGQFSYDPTAPGWVFNGLSGIAANNSGFTSQNPPAPEGVQVAFLQNSGTFSQAFTASSNENFSITFSAAQRMMSTLNSQDFNVLMDNTVIGNFQPTTSTYQTFSTSTIFAGAGSHTLSFVGLNNSGDNTAFLDNILVSATLIPVPLPDSLILFLSGLGVMSMAKKGRKNNASDQISERETGKPL